MSEYSAGSTFQRFLGIDYGTKRIGLAIGDDIARIASPVAMVAARGSMVDHAKAVLAEAQEYELDAFVVGLPVNMDDSEGAQAKLTRQFGEILAKASGKPVHFFDERLSSHAARELLHPAELSRGKRKARLDAVAAQVILQSFLETLAPPELSDS